MEFDWNEEKRQQVLAERGVDLLYAALIFEGPTLTKLDERADYGEPRFISLGLVDDTPYIVVHTERDGRIRLITAWQGGRKDHETYRKRIP